METCWICDEPSDSKSNGFSCCVPCKREVNVHEEKASTWGNSALYEIVQDHRSVHINWQSKNHLGLDSILNRLLLSYGLRGLTLDYDIFQKEKKVIVPFLTVSYHMDPIRTSLLVRTGDDIAEIYDSDGDVCNLVIEDGIGYLKKTFKTSTSSSSIAGP